MKRKGLLTLCLSSLGIANAQYVDTIQSVVKIHYNNPGIFVMAANAGVSAETQAVDGGVIHPQDFGEVNFRPFSRFAIHAKATHQFNQFWQNQDINDTRTYEATTSIYLTQQTLKKNKVFTAGTKMYNYDFIAPVNVRWNTGIIGGYKQGSGVFNTGFDQSSAVQFSNSESDNRYHLDKIAVPFTFQEVSAGFVVSTNSRFKIDVTLPDGKIKSRRMKTYTQFSVQAVYGLSYDMAQTVVVRNPKLKNAEMTHNVHSGTIIPWGYKLAGTFNRKLTTLKVEAGSKPGAYQRFSGGESPSFVDRSYFSIGLGLGWM